MDFVKNPEFFFCIYMLQKNIFIIKNIFKCFSFLILLRYVMSLQIKFVVEQWGNKDCAQCMSGNSWLQDKIFHGNLCNSVGANPHNYS